MNHAIARLLCLVLLVPFAHAAQADPPATVSAGAARTAYPNTAFVLATAYFQTKPTVEEETGEALSKAKAFVAFMTAQGLKADGRMAAVVATLVVSTAKFADEEGILIEPDKLGFQLLLHEAAARTLQVTPAALAGGAVVPAPAAATDPQPAATPAPKQPAPKKVAKEGEATEAGKPATKEEVEQTIKDTMNEILAKDTKADFRNIQSYFHTGVTLLNPYHINTAPPALTLEPATETDMNAYLEFVYSNRWAWNQNRVNYTFELKDGQERQLKSDHDFDWVEQWDTQVRLGYTFSSGSTPSANTLAGSGDFNAEMSIGKPMIVYRSTDDVCFFSLGPEIGYSAVTEKSTIRSHSNWFAGLAYTAGFTDPFGSRDAAKNPRRVLLNVRLGQGWVDSVHYISDASMEIHVINGALPKYFHDGTLAFETQLLYPVKNSTFITFNTRVYPDLNPGLWSMQIGLTTSFSDLLGGFFK